MRRLLIAIFLLTSLCVQARSLEEQKKIEFLLHAVEQMSDAEFIRNGSTYPAKDAASHLQHKLMVAGERVHTAEEFIAGCASKSSTSGRPYLIRMPDGRVQKLDTFLRAKLKGS